MDARRFPFPLSFPRPSLVSGDASTSGGSPSRKRKKKRKNQRGGIPSRTWCTSALPSSRLRLNTIHCTAPSCLLISVTLIARYLHALRFAVLIFKLTARSLTCIRTHPYIRIHSRSLVYIYEHLHILIRIILSAGARGRSAEPRTQRRPLASHSTVYYIID